MSNTPASAEARTEEVDGRAMRFYQLGFAGELDAADVLNFMRALAIRPPAWPPPNDVTGDP